MIKFVNLDQDFNVLENMSASGTQYHYSVFPLIIIYSVLDTFIFNKSN
jgi:hypothetical protein